MRSQPLPNAHPEFTVIDYPNFREYRVENWHLARDGSGRVIKKITGLSWRDAIAPLMLSLIWTKVQGSIIASAGLILVSILLIWVKCTQVISESVIVLHRHGIQFETHRGLPSLPLIASRRFIPATALQDFIINEGLRGWNVRYYLAAMKRSGVNKCTLEVAYENILPHFPVLLEVYHGVQDTLFASTANTQISNSSVNLQQ